MSQERCVFRPSAIIARVLSLDSGTSDDTLHMLELGVYSLGHNVSVTKAHIPYSML